MYIIVRDSVIGSFWWRMHVLFESPICELLKFQFESIVISTFRLLSTMMIILLPDLIVKDGSGYSWHCPFVVST